MNNKLGLKLIIAAIVCVHLWFVYIAFSYPVYGIDLKKAENNTWVISKFETTLSVSKLGLKIGDVILKVNGLDPNTYYSIVKWRTLDQMDTILAARDGQEFTVSTANIQAFTLNDVLAVSAEIISILMAMLLFKIVSHSLSARYLLFVFLNIGATFMSLLASIRGDALGKAFIGALLMLLPLIFLHFLIVFLKEKGGIDIKSKFIKYLYMVPSASLFIELIFFTKSDLVYYVRLYITNFIILFFIAGIFLNLTFLSQVYLKHRKERSYVSIIIKTVWVSLLISFSPIVVLSFIPMLLYGQEWVDPFYMSWFVLLFPMSFAYLITAQRLHDIDIILRRILFTAIISLAPSLVFVGIIALLFPNQISPQRLLIAGLLFIVILTYVLYLLEYITTKFERVMFPRKHQLQVALKKIAKNLGTISSFRELKDIFLVDIVSSLHVFGGAIVFKYADSVEIIREGDIDEAEVEQIILAKQRKQHYYSVLEINRHEEFTSYLIMTEKNTGTLIGTEETQWLNLIITYLSVSLENIHLIRKMTTKLQQLAAQIPNEQASNDFIWFRKLMFELQENERVRIATDLHDTTMQDLFFLKDRLQTLRDRNLFNEEDENQMVGIIGYIDIINANLRQSCFELHPYLLKEIGLVQTIDKLIRFERAISTFTIEYQVSSVSLLEQRDIETKRHIFRMVQELLNNAKKHSQASKLHLNLTVANNNIYLDYTDDGVGFEADEKLALTEIGASGIGMEQMKSRILSLNGHYKLETGKGKGMQFKVTFPLKEGQTA